MYSMDTGYHFITRYMYWLYYNSKLQRLTLKQTLTDSNYMLLINISYLCNYTVTPWSLTAHFNIELFFFFMNLKNIIMFDEMWDYKVFNRLMHF